MSETEENTQEPVVQDDVKKAVESTLPDLLKAMKTGSGELIPRTEKDKAFLSHFYKQAKIKTKLPKKVRTHLLKINKFYNGVVFVGDEVAKGTTRRVGDSDSIIILNQSDVFRLVTDIKNEKYKRYKTVRQDMLQKRLQLQKEAVKLTEEVSKEQEVVEESNETITSK